MKGKARLVSLAITTAPLFAGALTISGQALAFGMFGDGPAAGYAHAQYQNMITLQTNQWQKRWAEQSTQNRRSTSNAKQEPVDAAPAELSADETKAVIEKTLEMHYAMFPVRAMAKYCHQHFPQSYSAAPLQQWEKRNHAADMETILGSVVKADEATLSAFVAESDAMMSKWMDTENAGNQAVVCGSLAQVFQLQAIDLSAQPGNAPAFQKIAMVARNIRKTGTP
ncbi:hypothetical protein [Allohahella sp. A8]|uniref:hypothetical protein n=1 Tax=Allohahella sp. A8 TaxID=3141461 RepID=UPI003A8036A7